MIYQFLHQHKKYHFISSWFLTGLKEGWDKIIKWVVFFCDHVSNIFLSFFFFFLMWTRLHLFVSSLSPTTFVMTLQHPNLLGSALMSFFFFFCNVLLFRYFHRKIRSIYFNFIFSLLIQSRSVVNVCQWFILRLRFVPTTKRKLINVWKVNLSSH